MSPTRALSALAAFALLAGASHAAAAQLKSPFGSSNKGHIRGLDVTSMPDVVFVLDLWGPSGPPTPPSVPGSVGDAVGDIVEGQVAGLTQQKLIEKGGEVGLMAAGPAGMVVKHVLSHQGNSKDVLERAGEDVRHAIEGLADGQSFGVVVIAAGVHPWREALVPATKDLRKEAARFLKNVAPQGAVQLAALSGGGGGGLLQGLEAAFGMAPRTLVVVAAGAPADGSADVVLARVAELNAGAGAGIYTTCACEQPEAADDAFLRALAEGNSGTLLSAASD